VVYALFGLAFLLIGSGLTMILFPQLFARK